ncbi:MAG: SMC-Scp complex subunit ScpB [Acidiferrobacterales bacterium]|nr:SMC-Scp complex subunit ScpB [Acidiferrobacterales bacterium]
MDHQELKRIVEAAILTSDVPVTVEQLSSLFDEQDGATILDVERALLDIERDCENRGVELKRIGGGYRYQSREKYAEWLRRLSEIRPRRYSRALMETLSIIAFRQPVTRGDIESIRGVSVSTEIMRTLLTNEWIEQAGDKQVPGRPALFKTTLKFLEYFNLESLDDLPALDLLEKQASSEPPSDESELNE